MFDLFSRQSIVRYSKINHHRHSLYKKDFVQEIRQYAPNFKHKDGRVYASKNNEPYWVVTVSPYHPKFRTQVEDGVWPIVEPLINKSYLTVSSCEGHGTDQKLIVTLVFETINEANCFSEVCSQVPGWHFVLHDKQRKIHQSAKTSSGVIAEQITKTLDENFEEFKRYNLLFFKNYKKYVYLDMILYKFPEPILKRLFYRFILRRPCQEFYLHKQNMINFLTNHLPKNTRD